MNSQILATSEAPVRCMSINTTFLTSPLRVLAALGGGRVTTDKFLNISMPFFVTITILYDAQNKVEENTNFVNVKIKRAP
jgi:hypothetical protein